MNHIDEFLSPNFHGVAQQCFVVILLITIVALAVAAASRRCRACWSCCLRPTAVCTPRAAFRFRHCCSPWSLRRLLTQALAEARENAKSLFAAASFVSRWQAFTGRDGTSRTGFPRPSLAGGCGVSRHCWCVLHQGKLGSTQWMNAHFDPKNLPVQATECDRRNAASANRSSLPTPGVDT